MPGKSPDKPTARSVLPAEGARGGTDVSGDMRAIAGGSSYLLVGGLVNRGIRLLLAWFLTRFLGVAAFGTYTSATTLATVVATFAPLGADQGALMFGARYLKTGEHRRLKGMLLTGLLLSASWGALTAGALWWLTGWGGLWEERPELRSAMHLLSPVILPWAVLIYFTGVLRGYKAMAAQAKVYQVFLPALLLSLAALAVLLELGLPGVLRAFLVAHSAAFLWAAWEVWKRVRPLLRVRPLFEPWHVLRHSVPLGVTLMMFRVIEWMDILMLTWLVSTQEVGLYKVAASLAAVGSIPMAALTTMLSPVIAELAYVRELARLDAILKITTRWLLVLVAPFYLSLFLLPDLALRLFSPEHLACRDALYVLLAGQFVQVLLSPDTRLLPMAGYAGLNLLNALLAIGLNFGLNYWLIPRYGVLGASLATAATFLLWSGARSLQVWHLLRCQPVSRRFLALLATLLAAGLAVQLLLGHAGWAARLAGTAAANLAFFAGFWLYGRGPEDAEVFAQVKGRLLRRLGLGGRAR